LDVRWTSYGEPAARALHAAVAAAKDGDPLAPVTVVVPSNHVGVASRRLLASGRLGPMVGDGVGIAAVTFVTPYRLAELLGASTLAALGKRPVSTPVLAAAVRAELAADAGLFAPVREHPATEAALVATYRELRDCSAGALDALARTGTRAGEVVRLHRAVRGRIEPRWSDEEDLLDAATALVASPTASELGTVIVHLPQRLTLHAARFLAALGEHVPMLVLAGTAGDAAADAQVVRSIGRLGVEAASPPAIAVPAPVGSDRTTIVTTSDADEEVRAAVRAVVAAARGGTKADRIAVLHASPEPYARLAHEQLRAAGFTTNGAAIVPVGARMAGRTLLELLRLPDGGFRRQDLFAWLTAAPILVDGHLAPTTRWERVSRDAKVVAGRSDWDVHLLQHALKEEERAGALDADDDEPEWAAQRARTTAARARVLRRFGLHVIDDLAEAAAAPRRWSEHRAWAKRWVEVLLGQPEGRGEWPIEEQKAADRVDRAVDRLGALDAVEGPVPLEVFTRTLELELENDLGRVGRLGEGVLVGSVEMGTGLDLDLVVVVGLAEGSFPTVVRDDSLLPDGERAATAGELGLRADQVGRQHRELLAAVAGAAGQVLCVPRGDLRQSASRTPSRWVLELASAVDGRGEPWWPDDLDTTTVPWVQHVASFDAGLRISPVPATEQEHRLRALLASGGDLEQGDDDTTRRGAEVVTARRSARFTRFDGNLAGVDVPSPTARVTSPTRLERWATCPHRHLVEDLLRAPAVENPEDELMITPLDRGNLVHAALERFLAGVLEGPEDSRPGPTDPWTPSDHQRMEEIGAALCDQAEALGITGRALFWTRDRRRVLDDLAEFLLRDSIHRIQTGTVPDAVDVGFGFGDGLDAVTIPLSRGRTLRVRGRADRLDRAVDGRVHVTDYKTGRSARFAKLSEDNPVAAGTKLQLPVYGLAGRLHVGDPGAPVRADYWFTSAAGGWQRIGYELTDEVLAHTVAVLDTIVDGIEAGVFPARPLALASTANAYRVDCPACDPDGLGTVELRAAWDRKRHDPALATYADLAEPLEDPRADPLQDAG
jgi:RecB family exonuclease